MSDECKCDMRTKLVGDGCEVCNPEAQSSFAAPAGWAAQTWWPECPWPEDVWANTLAQITPKYVELVADEHIRTCISGVLMRHGWRLAEKEIMERLTEAGIVPPNSVLCDTPIDSKSPK